MSRAHSVDRAFRWLIYSLLAAVPISVFLNYLYPVASRQIWVTLMEWIRVGGLWLINPYSIGIVFLLVTTVIVIGVGAIVVNGLRAVFA